MDSPTWGFTPPAHPPADRLHYEVEPAAIYSGPPANYLEGRTSLPHSFNTRGNIVVSQGWVTSAPLTRTSAHSMTGDEPFYWGAIIDQSLTWMIDVITLEVDGHDLHPIALRWYATGDERGRLTQEVLPLYRCFKTLPNGAISVNPLYRPGNAEWLLRHPNFEELLRAA